VLDSLSGPVVVGVFVLAVVLAYFLLSLTLVGSTEVGLVAKRFGRKLSDGHVIAFKKEAGYESGTAHAGPPLQAVVDLRREEIPVGADTGRR
jgi:hypothetical protein